MAIQSKQNLSSPSVSPTYKPGAVSSVKSNAPIVDYKRRLGRAYQSAVKKKPVAKVPVKGNNSDTEYTALMNKYKGDLAAQRDAAANLFKRNRGALENDLNTTRDALGKQRGTDLNDIADNAAARGIGRSSGIYQQAGTDYENSYAERLRNADKTFNQQVNQEEETQNDTVKAANASFAEDSAAAAAARKSAALDKAKATAAPTPKTVPKAAPKSKTPVIAAAPKGKAPTVRRIY